MATNWEDEAPETPQGPFGIAPVDKIAYVDNDDPVELRGADVYSNIPKPQPRQRPQARKVKSERRWSTEAPMPEVKQTGRRIGNLIRAIVAAALICGFAWLVWTLYSGLGQSVKPPVAPSFTQAPAASTGPSTGIAQAFPDAAGQQ